MRRRTMLLLLSCLFAIPACQEQSKPPLQTIPIKSDKDRAPPKDDGLQPPTAEEKKLVQERLDQAIVAHGGPIRLKRLRNHVEILKGRVLNGRFGLVQADRVLKLQFPDKLRFDVKANTPQGLLSITVAVDGTNAWMDDATGVKDPPASVAPTLIEELHLRNVMTLLPLKEGDFVIRPIEGESVQGRPTFGIRVGSKGHDAVNLYFDAESKLLVRALGWFNEAGVKQLRENLFSDHKPVEGVQLPTHVRELRDGATAVDCAADYRLVKEFDAKEFRRP